MRGTTVAAPTLRPRTGEDTAPPVAAFSAKAATVVSIRRERAVGEALAPLVAVAGVGTVVASPASGPVPTAPPIAVTGVRAPTT